VPSDDLSSIPELHDKHHRVLAEQLKITTFRALVHADRRDIHRAMRYLRPRPTLEQIAVWQDHGRSKLSEAAAPDRSDWHPVASFAVVFWQRQAGDGWERRLAVERTEVEPEQEGRTWPGWDCGEICSWMVEQVGGNDGSQAQAVALPAAGAGAPEGGTAPAAAPVAAQASERARLRIGRVAVIDPAGRVEMAGPGAPEGAARTDPPGPVRVEITIGGARRGQEVHAVARVLPAGDRGWNPHEPVVRKGAGPASLDLSGLPPGQHDVTVYAWVPDGTAEHAVLKLPALTILPEEAPPS
jgi:hypothetical protein